MIYTLLISICFLFSIFDIFIIKSKKKKIYLMIVFIIIYTFILGRRGFLAWDWVHYYPNFINISSLKEFFIKREFGLNDPYEFGYMLWLSFCKTIFNNNYDVYVLFTTFLDIILLSILFFMYSPYPIFSIFVFLIFGGFGFQLDLMRNIKALILFLFSLNYINKKKYFKAFLLVILSLCIHRTSLIYLFLILSKFLEKEIKKKYLLIIFFIGIFVYIFGDDFLKDILKGILNILNILDIDVLKGIQNKLNIYLNSSFGIKKGIIKIGLIEKIITFFIIYFNYEKIKINYMGRIFLNLYIAYIIIFFYTNGVEVFHDRMELLFISSYWIIYSIVLNSYPKNKKIFLFLFISMIFFAKYINYYKNTLCLELYKYNTSTKNVSNYSQKYKLLKNTTEFIDNRSKK